MESEELEDQQYDYLFKIVIAGNSGVGKSNIVHRYARNKFNENSDFTIGVEFDEKIVTIKDKRIKLQLWDASGKKMYLTIAKKHFSEWVGAILVYDVTDSKSFENIPDWIREIEEEAELGWKYLLLPSKCDFSDKYPRMKQVPNELARQFIDKNKHILCFGEWSAKSNINVNFAINKLVENILDTQTELIKKGEKEESHLKVSPEVRNRINEKSSWAIF